MPKPIKKAGDLREFLGEVMADVRAGNVDAQDAQAIAKLAAQVNHSFYTEAMMAHKFGSVGAGDLLLGERPQPKPLPAPEPISDEEVTEVRAMLERGEPLKACAGFIGCTETDLVARLEAA